MSEIELEAYLCKRYGLIKLTPGIKRRLIEAYESSLHVQPERLLSCWRQMEQYLNNARSQNVARGNDMSGVALLGYDLSVVLNKYESFMRYITAAEKQNEEVNDAMDLHELTQNVLKYNKPKIKELKNVSDLVEEIYDSIGATK